MKSVFRENWGNHAQAVLLANSDTQGLWFKRGEFCFRVILWFSVSVCLQIVLYVSSWNTEIWIWFLTFWCLLPTQISVPLLLSCLCPAAWCLDLHILQDLPARWVSIEFYIFTNLVMCSALSVCVLLSWHCLWELHWNPFYLKRAIWSWGAQTQETWFWSGLSTNQQKHNYFLVKSKGSY